MHAIFGSVELGTLLHLGDEHGDGVDGFNRSILTGVFMLKSAVARQHDCRRYE
jgi:hypothetical protein